MERIIGTYSDNKEALLLVTAGIHGNEPSGIIAMEKVFSRLKYYQPLIKGTIVGIRGNIGGLKNAKRFLEEDLNRIWTKENILSEKTDTTEKEEMMDILDVIRFFSEKEYTKNYFLDCHTTSAETQPFISVQDVGENDNWAHLFPLPVVRGFSDMVNGCIDHYLSRRGMTGFVSEAGQHNSFSALKNQECLIWLVIEKACGLNFDQIPKLSKYIETFRNSIKEQSTFEIIHRYTLAEGDRFVMEPGFFNFQKIEKGEKLATHNDKEVRSRWDSYIFMPLYQSQGEDGFYIIDRA